MSGLTDKLARLRSYLKASSDKSHDGILPDFCTGRMLVNIIVIAEMLALIITIVTRGLSIPGFQSYSTPVVLLLLSIFIQWVALTSAATLCMLRPYLNRLPEMTALAATYAALLVVTLIISEAAIWTLKLVHGVSLSRLYFHVQNLSISIVVNAIALRYLLNIHELQQRTYSEAQARLEALRARIRPHFVFNSLNIIASLINSQPKKAEHAIEDMAALFRMMLSETENLVPVRNEIEIAEQYIALERLRLEDRLQLEWQIGKLPRSAVIPVLTLQPLLENAIRHGIEARPEVGTIEVGITEENEQIIIRITNPLPDRKRRTRHNTSESPGKTLSDLRLRLNTHYGDAAQLESMEADGRFCVNVILPVRGETA